MKKFLLVVLVLVLATAYTSHAQFIRRPFTARYYNPSQKGNIIFVANSIVHTSAQAATGHMEVPFGGTSKNNGNIGNHIDVDLDAFGVTFNSSSANLSLPSCSNILFAGLYWGAGVGGTGSSTNDTAWIPNGANTIKFKLPTSAGYTNITSSQTDKFNQKRIGIATSHSGYMCFADVTALVTAQANPNGMYIAADIPSAANNSRLACYGGWTMVIAYADPTAQLRNLTVFDGCALVGAGQPDVDVPVTGFLTPPIGAVSCELGAVAIDGDRNDGVDGFFFRKSLLTMMPEDTRLTP